MKFIFPYAFIIFYLALRGSFVCSTLTDTILSIFDSNYKTDNSYRHRFDEDAEFQDGNISTIVAAEEEQITANDIERDTLKPKHGFKKRKPGEVFEHLTLVEQENDVMQAKNKSKILRMLRNLENKLNLHSPDDNKHLRASTLDEPNMPLGYDLNNVYHIDPVLNLIKNNGERNNFRRQDAESSSSMSSSSSREEKDFKTEFHEMWLHKKFEALNHTIPRGDQVNMIAARPWGVNCGDPNQHDMPWGTCMLAIECEPEYRIYRGDYFCGRTQFVCCALQLTNYDMYQGFDISFDEKSLSTDSDEKKNRKISSKEKRKRRKARERKKRQKARNARKKKIKHHIKKIIKEIRKILNKQYRNGTRQRKKRTKQLKKFIKDLKKQYKKDRQSVKDLHEEEMIKIDNELLTRLFQIKYVNEDFVKNATFRQILINGTISKKGARMLIEAYPELNEFLETRRDVNTLAGRRNGADDYLEYDIEYGYLYY